MTVCAPGSIIASRYRVERLLARGGMGSVWVARHLQLDAPVAIKLMEPSCAAAPDARMRFEREAKASAQLDSPHVVRVHDYGIESGSQFLVMELLQGEDLGVRLKRERLLTLSETATILGQVSKALRAAHEAGLVHRDLKPGNVFLARQQDEIVVKVLDFGIAKAVTATEATKTGVVLGSPHYMSPEQARSSKWVDYRSDLWSLGVIAFRCLTGRLPFPGEELTEVLLSICTGPIPVASQVAPHLGPEVDRFFERALARDPARRFQSARELAEALGGLAGGRPTSASSGALARCAEAQASELSSSVAGATSDHASGTLAATGKTLPPVRERRTAFWVFIFGALPIAMLTSTLVIVRWRSAPTAPRPEAAISPDREPRLRAPAIAAAPESTPDPASLPASESSVAIVADGGAAEGVAPAPPSPSASPAPQPKSGGNKDHVTNQRVQARDPRLRF